MPALLSPVEAVRRRASAWRFALPTLIVLLFVALAATLWQSSSSARASVWLLVGLMVLTVLLIGQQAYQLLDRHALYDSVENEYRAHLSAAQSRYETLVQKLPVAAYFGPADATASTSYFSPAIENMLGYSSREWIEDDDFWPKVL